MSTIGLRQNFANSKWLKIRMNELETCVHECAAVLWYCVDFQFNSTRCECRKYSSSKHETAHRIFHPYAQFVLGFHSWNAYLNLKKIFICLCFVYFFLPHFRLAGSRPIRKPFKPFTSMSSLIIHVSVCRTRIPTHGIYTSRLSQRMIVVAICANWIPIQWRAR